MKFILDIQEVVDAQEVRTHSNRLSEVFSHLMFRTKKMTSRARNSLKKRLKKLEEHFYSCKGGAKKMWQSLSALENQKRRPKGALLFVLNLQDLSAKLWRKNPGKILTAVRDVNNVILPYSLQVFGSKGGRRRE